MPRPKSQSCTKPQPKPASAVDSVAKVPKGSPIFDKIASLRGYAVEEFHFLTATQAANNPFDPIKEKYQWLARSTMLVLKDEDKRKLENDGYKIEESKSSVYGDHIIVKRG